MTAADRQGSLYPALIRMSRALGPDIVRVTENSRRARYTN